MTGLRAAWQRVTAGFTSLAGSPRDLYLVYILKVLESYNYFSLSRILTLYLTEEFGINDYRAGTCYGVWGTLLTLYGLFFGGAIDLLGVKASLIVCFALNFSSRFVMAYTETRWLLLLMLFGPNAVAGALGVPVMTIAVKRFTTPGNRGFAFSLFYTLMNLAALSQGLFMDLFRITFKHGFNIASLPAHHLLNDGTRLFLFSGCCTSLAGILISWGLASPQIHHGSALGRKPNSNSRVLEGHPLRELNSPEASLTGGGAHNGDDVVQGSPVTHAQPHTSVQTSFPSCIAHWFAACVESMRGVVSTGGFWRFMAMCIFMVNLKGVFRHLDATLPKYQLRAFGCDAPIGLVYSINPAMIVCLVPFVGAVTTVYAHFDMIHYGAYISALSPLMIVAFDTEWSTAGFVAVLSLGEAIWSPRWYDYSMSVAPDGKEGIFTALTSAPLFVAMLPTGMVSGALLQAYCPDQGQCIDATTPNAAMYECNGRSLWGIVCAITMSSPLLITLTQSWVRPTPEDMHPPHHIPTINADVEPSFDVNEADPLVVVERVCHFANVEPLSP